MIHLLRGHILHEKAEQTDMTPWVTFYNHLRHVSDHVESAQKLGCDFYFFNKKK